MNLAKKRGFSKETWISSVKKWIKPKNCNEFRGMSVSIGKFHSNSLIYSLLERLF